MKSFFSKYKNISIIINIINIIKACIINKPRFKKFENGI